MRALDQYTDKMASVAGDRELDERLLVLLVFFAAVGCGFCYRVLVGGASVPWAAWGASGGGRH